jgi:phytoene dehydrogenase-like protein
MTTTAVILGADVDSLVAAHVLARAGHRVLVLDPRAPGTREPTFGWIPPVVLRELGLDPSSVPVERPEVWASAALEGGGTLDLSADMARSVEAIRRISPRDAVRWPAFCARLAPLARLVESLYVEPPPDPMTSARDELWKMAATALRARRMGKQALVDLMRILPMPVAELLDDWFESDALKGLLGAMAVRHHRQGPRSSGTAFGLLHHHVGNAPGVFIPPRSSFAQMLAERSGVEIRRGVPLERIDVRDGRVAGVTLVGGETIGAALVMSSESPRRVLLEQVDAKWLDPALVRAVRNLRSRGVVARVTLTLDAAPGFDTLVVAPSLDYLQRAHDDAKYGRVSREPWLEARSIGADGEHRTDITVQCAPYTLADGEWTDARRTALGQLASDTLSTRVPGLAARIRAIDVQTPRALESTHGWPEGQAYHAELALDQLLWMRPTPALARYGTPIGGLYLCGPATHPGAGVAGAAGANAARAALRAHPAKTR